MSRPVNKQRPEELRQAIVQYLTTHGLADLSLRPLAKAVGSSPRVLLYYFGSKENMVASVLAEIRQRQRAAFGKIAASTFEQAYRLVWKQMSSPASEPLFRLFFEACGLALRHPRQYKQFLQSTVRDWLDVIAADLCAEGINREQASIFATAILAGFRGFMLDYCATHDRGRIDRAVDLWLRLIPLPRRP
jgi:AcrR family transcriptional regulator